MTTKIVVDPELCMGMGTCESISSVFQVGDGGIVEIGDTTDIDPHVLRRAVTGCPTAAL